MAEYPELQPDGTTVLIYGDNGMLIGQGVYDPATGSTSGVRYTPEYEQQRAIENYMLSQAQQQAYTQAQAAADDAYRQAILSGQSEDRALRAAQHAAEMELQRSRLDLDRERFGLERRLKEADLQANPRNIFAAAYYAGGANYPGATNQGPQEQPPAAPATESMFAPTSPAMAPQSQGMQQTQQPITSQPPQIPRFANGGIVTRPTLGLLGERGPEAVVPLTGGGIRFNNGYNNSSMAQSMSYNPSPSGGSAGYEYNPSPVPEGFNPNTYNVPLYSEIRDRFGTETDNLNFPNAPQVPLPSTNRLSLGWLTQLNPFEKGLLEAAYSTAGLSSDLLYAPMQKAQRAFRGSNY